MEIIPNYYNPRILLEQIILDLDKVLKEEALWLCAWCYRCHKRCPQGLRLPEIFLSIRKIAAEKGYLQGLEGAIKRIKEEIPLPAICTLVCFHPERAQVDKSIIKKAIKQLLDYKFKQKMISKPKKPEKIAIVGSGPAGLTAAYELLKMGYSVTVFESLPKAGGMLEKCIPDFKLPRKVLNAEIEHLTKLGVEIRTGVTVGKDITFKELLKKGFEAVFIAVGAHKGRKMGVNGENLKGVIHALDFLIGVNLGKEDELGNRVAVIGGGDVAIDAARAALRKGAKEVHILYRRSREEMPADPWEVREAENEGAKIRFLIAPNRILGKNGRATTMECVRMKLGEPDETGRRRPIPVEGSDFIEKWDTIILAIGEIPDLSFLPKEIELFGRTIAVNPITMETSLPGVFAGGDAVTGPASVMEAIVAGKRAAFSIDHHLKDGRFRTEERVEQVAEAKE